MWSFESKGVSRLSASIGLITWTYGSNGAIRSAGLRGLEAPVERADRDELFLLPQDRASESDFPRPHERLAEQLERLQADLLRTEVVVPLPVQRRNLRRIDEARDLERLRRLQRDLLEVLVLQDHVLAFRVLVALHHRLRVYGHVVFRTDVRPLQGGHARGMQSREGKVLRLGRA